MPHSPLGNTIVIANPASHSGKGAVGAEYAHNFLHSYTAATKGFCIQMTQKSGDATNIARNSGHYDTILALGGDGLIHEVVQGLMELPATERPQLGVIAMGSGNDYARTLGMARNDVEAALAQLVRATPQRYEVGYVSSDAGESAYFMETLSFGFDAAIALDTTKRRAADTSQEGESLYITSGIKVMARSSKGFPCTVSFDGKDPLSLPAIILAMQVGPTYGGGFRVCPEADPTDGLLDACYNIKKPSIPRLLALFGLTHSGRHINSGIMATRRFSHASVTFESEVPCQVDGEALHGKSFDVEVLPSALTVLTPHA